MDRPKLWSLSEIFIIELQNYSAQAGSNRLEFRNNHRLKKQAKKLTIVKGNFTSFLLSRGFIFVYERNNSWWFSLTFNNLKIYMYRYRFQEERRFSCPRSFLTLFWFPILSIKYVMRLKDKLLKLEFDRFLYDYNLIQYISFKLQNVYTAQDNPITQWIENTRFQLLFAVPHPITGMDANFQPKCNAMENGFTLLTK